MLFEKTKKLLFIAPHLPRFDKQSGDLRLYRFLEILSRKHEVVFLALETTGEGAESERAYQKALEELNILTYVKDFSFLKILLRYSFRAAIIEFYYIAEHYIPRIKTFQPNCHVIIDTVDLHYKRIYSKHALTNSPHDLLLAEKTKSDELRVYSKSDLVVAVTDEDADMLRKDCPGLHIRTIPNIHDPEPLKDQNGNRNLLFVGGFSHDPNVDAVLYFCSHIFPLIQSSVTECKLIIVGNNPPEEIRNLQSESIHVAGFVPSLEPVFENSYISVAPLRFGSGMKGKVGEAMSKGLPVVTTSIGAQGMGLMHRHTAMISDSPEGFAGSVVELLLNESLYKTIRTNALDHITKMCGIEVVGKKVNDLINELQSITPRTIRPSEKFKMSLNYLKKITK